MKDKFRNNPFEGLGKFKLSESGKSEAQAQPAETKPVDNALLDQICQGLGADEKLREKIRGILSRAARGVSHEVDFSIFDPWNRRLQNPMTTHDQETAYFEAKKKIDQIVEEGKEFAAAECLKQLSTEKDPSKRTELVRRARENAIRAQNCLKNIADKVGVSLQEWPEIEAETVRPGSYQMTISATTKEGKVINPKQRLSLNAPGKDTSELEKQALGWVSMMGLHNYGVPAGEVSFVLTHEKDPDHKFSFRTRITASGHIET